MATWFWIVIVVVIVVIALVAAVTARRRRTTMLRQRFGSEYDRTVEARESQRAGEAELRERERERGRLDIKPLSAESRARYTAEWRTVQQSFVDQPEEATAAAYDLVNRVMAERGYPVRDFAAQADLVSVDHPDVVENYRVAHRIHERARRQEASTEDLREALLRYRSLFEELLPDGAAPAAAASTRHTAARPAARTAATLGPAMTQAEPGPEENTGPDQRGRPVRPASEADLLEDNDPLLELVAAEDDPGAGQQHQAGREQRAQLVAAGERERLGSRVGTGEDVSTEQLRQALRRYRSLFERLLAA